jgi:hypothetical protein
MEVNRRGLVLADETGACGFPLTTRQGEVSNFVHTYSKSNPVDFPDFTSGKWQKKDTSKILPEFLLD